MEKPIKQDDPPSLKPPDEKSGFDKFLDRASKVFVILGGMAMIWVTIHFSQVASSLSEQGIQNSQAQRRYSIQPALEVLPTIDYTVGFDLIKVRVRNYGVGQAIGVQAVVVCDGEIINLVHHQFVGDHLDSILTGKTGIRQEEVNILGETTGKDWIEPGETVRFSFVPWYHRRDSSGMTRFDCGDTFTIFLSYFDIDHEEHLTVSKMMAGSKSNHFVSVGNDVAFRDSLLALSSDLELFKSRTYDNLHLRSETEWFRILNGDSSAIDSAH